MRTSLTAVFSTESLIELVAPHVVEQRVLGEQGSGLPRERAQQTERARCKSDGLAIAQQKRVRFVQFESVEAHAHRIRGGSACAVCVGYSATYAVRSDICSIHLQPPQRCSSRLHYGADGRLRATLGQWRIAARLVLRGTNRCACGAHRKGRAEPSFGGCFAIVGATGAVADFDAPPAEEPRIDGPGARPEQRKRCGERGE